MKKVFVLLVLVFCFGLVAAHSDYYDIGEGYVYKERIVESEYFPDEHLTVSRTTYVDYENDERYPTEDYKYGYTYRATSDYLNKRYRMKTRKVDYERRGYRKYDRYDDRNRDYYFKYDWRRDDYEKIECWHEAPRGHLFYWKCP